MHVQFHALWMLDSRPWWRNYRMRTKWESPQPWLSESIVTLLWVKPHAGADCWSSVANLAVFPRILACFLWICVFFDDLRVACFDWNLLIFGLVFLQIYVLQIAFLKILWPFCSFNLLQNEIWVCFCLNLLILGLFFFRICFPVFVFN